MRRSASASTSEVPGRSTETGEAGPGQDLGSAGLKNHLFEKKIVLFEFCLL